jgi:hypothetical protein
MGCPVRPDCRASAASGDQPCARARQARSLFPCAAPIRKATRVLSLVPLMCPAWSAQVVGRRGAAVTRCARATVSARPRVVGRSPCLRHGKRCNGERRDREESPHFVILDETWKRRTRALFAVTFGHRQERGTTLRLSASAIIGQSGPEDMRPPALKGGKRAAVFDERLTRTHLRTSFRRLVRPRSRVLGL